MCYEEDMYYVMTCLYGRLFIATSYKEVVLYSFALLLDQQS